MGNNYAENQRVIYFCAQAPASYFAVVRAIPHGLVGFICVCTCFGKAFVSEVETRIY